MSSSRRDSSKNGIMRSIMFAYSEVCSQIFPKAKRSLSLGYVLIIVRYYILFQTNFLSFSTEAENSGNTHSSILSYTFLYARIKDAAAPYTSNDGTTTTTIQNSSLLLNLLYVSIILNATILAYFLVRMCFVIAAKKKSCVSFEIKPFDFIYVSYNYILTLPAFYLAIVFFSEKTFLSLISFALIVINGMIVLNGDQSYEYERSDSLQKRNTHIFTFELLFDLIGSILHFDSDSGVILYAYILGVSLGKLYFHLMYFPYYHEQIVRLNVQLSLGCSITSLILIISDSYATTAILSAIPCAYAIGGVIFDAHLSNLITNCMSYGKSSLKQHSREKQSKKYMSFLQQDIYCRYLSHNLSFYFLEYAKSPLSPLLEQIVTDHKLTCNDTLTCFCNSINEITQKVNTNDNVERERFMDSEDRKQYLFNYIKHLYLQAISKELSKKERNEAFFTYFSFLGQIMQNYSAVFLEIQSFRSSEESLKSSINDQARLQRLNSQLNDSFFLQQNSLASSSSTLKMQNSLLDIIAYDEKLSNIELKFKDCLNKKQSLLAMLCEPDIHLSALRITLQVLFDARESLNTLFVEIVSFACYSSYLRYLCEGFQLCLSPNSTIVTQMKYIKKFQPSISKIPHYDESSCVAFVSLQPSTFNRITSVSKNFYETTRMYTNADAIGKSIDFVLPNALASQHTAMMRAYFQKDAISLKIMEKPKVIGQNPKGWAMPYQIKFQVSYTGTMSDIGLAVWIKQIQDDRLHIVTDLSPQLSVHTLSQGLYANLFSEIVTTSTLDQILISKWIPLLSAHEKIFASCINQQKERGFYKQPTRTNSDGLTAGAPVWQQQQQEKLVQPASDSAQQTRKGVQEERVQLSFETILIKPDTENLGFAITEENFFDDFMQLDLYGVNFDLVFVRNPFFNFLNITINSIEKLSAFEDKQDYILRFKQQVGDLGIRFDHLPPPMPISFQMSTRYMSFSRRPNSSGNGGSTQKNSLLNKDHMSSFQDYGFGDVKENSEEDQEDNNEMNLNANDEGDENLHSLVNNDNPATSGRFPLNSSRCLIGQQSLQTGGGGGQQQQQQQQQSQQLITLQPTLSSMKDQQLLSVGTPISQKQFTQTTNQNGMNNIQTNNYGFNHMSSNVNTTLQDNFTNDDVVVAQQQSQTILRLTGQGYSSQSYLPKSIDDGLAHRNSNGLIDLQKINSDYFKDSNSNTNNPNQNNNQNSNNTTHIHSKQEMGNNTQNNTSVNNTFQILSSSQNSKSLIRSAIAEYGKRPSSQNLLKKFTIFKKNSQNNKDVEDEGNQDINLQSRNSLMHSGRKNAKNEIIESGKKTNNNLDIEIDDDDDDDDDAYSNSDTVERKKKKELAKSSQTASRNLIKRNNKMSTAASAQNSEKSDRYVLQQFMAQKNGLTGIQFINIMGGLSMLGIAIVSIIGFYDNFTQLQYDQENFQFVNWLSSVNGAISIVNTDLTIKRNSEIRFFVLTDQARTDLLAAIDVDMIDYNNIMRNLLIELSTANRQNFIMFNSLVGVPATEQLFNGENAPIQTLPITFVYKIITQAAYLTIQAYKHDPDMIFQHNAELNFTTLNSLVWSVLDTINERFSQQSENQQANSLFWLFVFGSISLLFSLSVVPTYTFIMNKQTQILYLFATFEPDKIQLMESNIISCRMLLAGNSHIKDSIASSSRKGSVSLNPIQRKKKNISNTHPLVPSYIRICIIVILFFVFLQLQPLTDYLLSSEFLTACANRYSLIVKVMNMQESINQIIQTRQSYMLTRFNGMYAPLKEPYYLEFVRTTSVRSVDVFNKFFATIAEKEKYITYETQLMQDFFYTAIEKNACSTIEAFPQYTNGIAFNRTTCEVSNKGVLKAGVSVAMNDFVTGFVTFYEQALGTDNVLFLTEVNSFFTNMRDRFYAKKYMTNSLEFLIIFLKIINYEQYSRQIVIAQVLIAWQLIAIFIAFFFGFTRYSQYIQRQVQQTKEYIGLIEIPVLIYNPYIQSYLKRFS